MPGYVKRAATSDPTYKPTSGARRKRRPRLTGAAVPKPITVQEVYMWGRLFLTEGDMAQLARVSRSTIQAIKRDETYRRAYEQGRAEALAALKQAQYTKAMAGDTRMLIFLGKVVLGQSVKPATQASPTRCGVRFADEHARKERRKCAIRQLGDMDRQKRQELCNLLLTDRSFKSQ